MEKLGLQGLAVLLILLPGFLCAGIIQALCVRSSQTELDKIRDALLYSFVIYVIFVCLFGSAVPLGVRVTNDQGVQRYGVELHPDALVELALISLILAFSIGGGITNDIWGRLFRKLRLSRRTSRTSVWSDTFHTFGGVVLVELGDGRRVEGWLRYYSSEAQGASLFLEKAAWVSDEDKLVPINGPGILITEHVGIRTIEFLRWKTNKKTDTDPGTTKGQT